MSNLHQEPYPQNNHMSAQPIKILLIDQDPIFRLGLQAALAYQPNIDIVSTAETQAQALQFLLEAEKNSQPINLIVIELSNHRSFSIQKQGLELCQQIKTQYPPLPVLLLSTLETPELILTAKAVGVNGYCPKGSSISELITAIEAIVADGDYWLIEPTVSPPPLPLAKFRKNLYLSGVEHIDTTLAQLSKNLQTPGLPLIERVVFAGQRRELLATRWLLSRLLISPQEKEQEKTIIHSSPTIRLSTPPISSITPTTDELLTPISLQSEILSVCVNKLQLSLLNVTDDLLEIDILRTDKKRELLYLILQQLFKQIAYLRSYSIKITQLAQLRDKILYDLWQSIITDFFGKFSWVQVSGETVEVVDLLLSKYRPVQLDILNKIPLVSELFAYLLFETDLNVDNQSYPATSEDAKSQALKILENLLIQLANGVIQPLLNSLADVEVIKQTYYDRKLISTREIERFRNQLSWKYRLKKSIGEPKAIFESSHELLVLAPRGIAKTYIYAPRGDELATLTGIPLLVTLLLELRDALAPRLQSLLAFLGSGIVFILTKIVGRGLGLIARGILQGIGSVSLTDKNLKHNSDRSN